MASGSRLNGRPFARRGPGIIRGRTDQHIVGALLHDMRRPTCDAAQDEDGREERRRNFGGGTLRGCRNKRGTFI